MFFWKCIFLIQILDIFYLILYIRFAQPFKIFKLWTLKFFVFFHVKQLAVWLHQRNKNALESIFHVLRAGFGLKSDFFLPLANCQAV